MSNQPEYLTFGSTAVNLAAVLTMSEEEFKSMLIGVIDYDIDKAWREVLKHKPKEPTQPKKKRKRFTKSED